jgi:ADP-heptose:LPS heptosyltransferase
MQEETRSRMAKKFLFIRLSSIGDIVLTTPVIRCLREQMPEVEIHYLCKKQYAPILRSNPCISKIHLFADNFQELIPKLKAEQFDYIIDLHKNFRSHYLRLHLRKPSGTFSKLNVRKWLITRFGINILPDIHIVDRYFNAVKGLGVRNDGKGLDYFLLPSEEVNIPERFPEIRGTYLAMAIGGRYNTKVYPPEKAFRVCDLVHLPVILLGGKEDIGRGDLIARNSTNLVVNACGKLTINESASVIRQAERVISNDTGMMHIAAAFKKPLVSIWGNTIPAFGMYPYFPEEMKDFSAIVEVGGLKCRPCSKLGYKECPRKHFDCMNKIEPELIARLVREKGNY